MLEGLGAGWRQITQGPLTKRTDHLALFRGRQRVVTVIHCPAVAFTFPDAKWDAYRRSMLHLSLISPQSLLRESMSEGLLFAKITEPVLTEVIFNNHFRDLMSSRI